MSIWSVPDTCGPAVFDSPTNQRGNAVQNMLANLRARREDDERGFTLIELMVVVLIIAILIAIAIPTFLGASPVHRTRRLSRASATALTNAKSIYTDQDSYGVGRRRLTRPDGRGAEPARSSTRRRLDRRRRRSRCDVAVDDQRRDGGAVDVRQVLLDR